MKKEIINVKIECWETLTQSRDFLPIFTNQPARRATHRNLWNFKGIDSLSAGKEIKSPPYSLVQRRRKHPLISVTTNRQQFTWSDIFCSFPLPSPSHDTSSLKCISQGGDITHTTLNQFYSLTKAQQDYDQKILEQKKEEVQSMDVKDIEDYSEKTGIIRYLEIMWIPMNKIKRQ